MTIRDRGFCRIRRKPEAPTVCSFSDIIAGKAPVSNPPTARSLTENCIPGFAAACECFGRFPVLRFLGSWRETLRVCVSSWSEMERCRLESSVP